MQTHDDFIQQLGDREYFGQRPGLERIQQVLERSGNPERKFPSIHIAGTNGKGSTAAMITSILGEAGYRVGLYTSPHIVDFCERIKVGVERIIPDHVLQYARQIHEIETDPLTFFELATAIAFLHFSNAKVDIAVVEVGMGGRLDATNVITPLVSVITTIGLDHMQHLGDSLEKIAFEKAGIVKPGVPVVTGALLLEAEAVIHKVARERGAPVILSEPVLSRVEGSKRFEPVGLPGAHQLQNAAIAVRVIEELEKQGWSIPKKAIQNGLESVKLPGRLETIQKEPWILLDGAHNCQAMQAVRGFLEPRLKGRRLKVLFAAMADKDLNGILSELSPITHEFIFTALDLKRAADPGLLLSIGRSLGIQTRVIRPAQEAFELMRGSLQKNEVLLVTGSFYLAGEIKKTISQSSVPIK